MFWETEAATYQLSMQRHNSRLEHNKPAMLSFFTRVLEILVVSITILAKNFRHHPLYKKAQPVVAGVARFCRNAADVYTPCLHFFLSSTEEFAERCRPGDRRRPARHHGTSPSSTGPPFVTDDDRLSAVSSIGPESNLSLAEHIAHSALSVRRSVAENLLAKAKPVVQGSVVMPRIIYHLYYLLVKVSPYLPRLLVGTLQACLAFLREVLVPPKLPVQKTEPPLEETRPAHPASAFPARSRGSSSHQSPSSIRADSAFSETAFQKAYYRSMHFSEERYMGCPGPSGFPTGVPVHVGRGRNK